jgi:hypothetical protein
MLLYVLIGLSLVLLGIAGLQFTYLFYVDRLYRERKNYTQLLEHKCARLNNRLDAAERKIARQDERLAALRAESGMEDEMWADVIDDR